MPSRIARVAERQPVAIDLCQCLFARRVLFGRLWLNSKQSSGSENMASPYDTDFDRNPANFQPLTPLSFLARAAAVYPDHPAVIHGVRSFTYRDFYARTRRLASALAQRGIKRGDTVAVVLANTPAMLEAHYGVAMAGGVLNTINTRLDAAIIAFTLDHGDAKVLITDREYSRVVGDALAACKNKPLVIDYDDPEFTGAGERLGAIEYEDFLRGGDPDFAWLMPNDEWDAISLNYTSGTTAARICWRWRMLSPAAWASIRFISGRCRCSIATAGASPGRCPWLPAPMSACVRCARRRCTTPLSRTRSRICAAHRS